MKNKITLFCSYVLWAVVVSLLLINNEAFANETKELFGNEGRFSEGVLDVNRNDILEDDIEKITICHKLKIGNDWKFVTLSIPKSALQAHLDHGDSVGSCDDKASKPIVVKKVVKRINTPPDVTLQCNEDYSSASTGIATLHKDFKCLCPGLRLEESDNEIFRDATKRIILRKWRAVSNCGEEGFSFQKITIMLPKQLVWIIEPSNKTIQCNGVNVSVEFSNWLNSFSGEGGCSNAVVTNNSSGLSQSCGNTGNETVLFTLTDDQGETIQKSATFTVEDKTKPTWVVAPKDKNAGCDGADPFAGPNVKPNSPFNLWLKSFSGVDNCGNAIVANNAAQLTTGGQVNGSLTVTFTLIDDCGNFIKKDATYSVIDDGPPTWVISPEDKTISCDASLNINDAFNTWLTSFSGEDDCGDVVLTNNSNGLSDLCGNTGTETVTFTLTDDDGNSIEKEATFTVVDNTPPTWIVMPSDKTIECNGVNDVNTELTNWLKDVSGEDSCGEAIITQSDYEAIDLCGGTGYASVMFTLTDECGNFIETKATFTVVDNTPPTWTLMPADKTVECNGIKDVAAEFTSWLSSFTGTDSCGAVEVTNNSNGLSDLCGASGTEIVLFTLTDKCGNSIEKEATFKIEDKTPPTWTLMPVDNTVECDGVEDVDAEFTAWLSSFSGTDSCGTATVSYTSTGLSDLCGATGTETVLFTLTDECGNSIEKEATFTIADNTPPTWVVMPKDKIVECNGITDVNVELTNWLKDVSGEDSCGEAIITQSDYEAIDLCGGTGYASVMFTLTDECGNFIETKATFTVVDNTPPTWILMPEDKTIECSDIDSENTELTTWLNSFSGEDTCGEVEISHNSSGLTNLCGVTGSETVLFTLTDECGNSIEKEATFKIEDKTLPIITVPIDVTVECSEDYSSVSTGVATGTDSCGEVIITESDIEEASCGNSKIITRTWVATDQCGNFVEGVQKITIEDTTKPVLSNMPENITVACLSDVPGNQEITASDNCDDNVEVVFTQSELPMCGGEIINTWEATDDCGNKITYSQTVIVEDSVAPEFVEELPQDLTVECNEIPDPATLTMQDNCGGVVEVGFMENITTNDENCVNSYTVTRTWSVMDCSENMVEHIQVITVVDTIAPELIGVPENEITVNCSNIPIKQEVTAEDNCSAFINVEFTETITEVNDDGEYDIIRIWSAKDECGNENNFTQTITVEPLQIITLNSYEICVNDGFVNLSSLISDEANAVGVWVDEDNSGGLDGFTFDSSKVELGTYNFLFTYPGVNVTSSCLPVYALEIVVHDECVVEDCQTENGIEISKVVTPNGDRYNKVFEISDVRSCGFTPEVQIFNRWGHMVYQSNDYYNNWNGFHNNSGMTIGTGSKLPSGTYYYIVNIVGSGYKPMTGYIYLGNN